MPSSACCFISFDVSSNSVSTSFVVFFLSVGFSELDFDFAFEFEAGSAGGFEAGDVALAVLVLVESSAAVSVLVESSAVANVTEHID